MRLLFALLLFLLPATASAQTFVLATSDYPPFCSESGGLAMDIIDAALDAVGAKAKYEFLPWKRCEICLEAGECDGTFPYSYTPERAKKFFFSEPIFNSDAVFFMLKSKMPRWDYNGIDSLKGYKIACVHGYFYEEQFIKNGLDCHIVPTAKNAFAMLLEGRVDLVIDTKIIGLTLIDSINKHGRKLIKMSKTPIRSGVSYVMMKIGVDRGKKLESLFNKGLNLIKENGQYTAIFEKYDIDVRN